MQSSYFLVFPPRVFVDFFSCVFARGGGCGGNNPTKKIQVTFIQE